MKNFRVIVTKFLVGNASRIKLFQVKIPREAKSVAGVEMGMSWLVGALPAEAAELPSLLVPQTVRRNVYLGELKLQSYEKANIFYTGDLVLNRNSKLAELGNRFFAAKNYTHQYKEENDPIDVNGTTTILQGVYKDKLNLPTVYRYQVKVYLWLELKDEPNNI
jgi:hypothetical protein